VPVPEDLAFTRAGLQGVLRDTAQGLEQEGAAAFEPPLPAPH